MDGDRKPTEGKNRLKGNQRNLTLVDPLSGVRFLFQVGLILDWHSIEIAWDNFEYEEVEAP
jgi:hypothetical protein